MTNYESHSATIPNFLPSGNMLWHTLSVDSRPSSVDASLNKLNRYEAQCQPWTSKPWIVAIGRPAKTKVISSNLLKRGSQHSYTSQGSAFMYKFLFITLLSIFIIYLYLYPGFMMLIFVQLSFLWCESGKSGKSAWQRRATSELGLVTASDDNPSG